MKYVQEEDKKEDKKEEKINSRLDKSNFYYTVKDIFEFALLAN